jgi:hypothetical protein
MHEGTRSLLPGYPSPPVSVDKFLALYELRDGLRCKLNIPKEFFADSRAQRS